MEILLQHKNVCAFNSDAPQSIYRRYVTQIALRYVIFDVREFLKPRW